MAANPKCSYCDKSVFHAEEQQFDGKIFHIQCMGKYKKQSQEQDLRGRNVMYEKEADVTPAYYRTADGGQGARMESGKEYKGRIDTGNGHICGDCQAVVTASQNFCGGCGAQLG